VVARTPHCWTHLLARSIVGRPPESPYSQASAWRMVQGARIVGAEFATVRRAARQQAMASGISRRHGTHRPGCQRVGAGNAPSRNFFTGSLHR